MANNGEGRLNEANQNTSVPKANEIAEKLEIEGGKKEEVPADERIATKTRWIELEKEEVPADERIAGNGEFMDGSGAYMVVDPSSLYHGKGYSEWTTDWFNWFLSEDADRRNSGPVVFLRSLGLPNKFTGSYISDVTGQATGSDSLSDSMGEDMVNYSKLYMNDPNIRIGGDRLKIFEDQAVLVPIIIAYWIKYEPSLNEDWGSMSDFVGSTIDNGDSPPELSQLTINNRNIELPLDEDSMERFRIVTPIFSAVVPDTQYGRSVKDFLEISVAPGNYPAMVEGYFVMLKFRPGSYWIHSWASAPRERRGPYFSELIYQVEVNERKIPHGRVSRWRPSRNERLLNQILEQKRRTKDLIPSEISRFQKYFIKGTKERQSLI
jgi:hypothetical protein